MNSMPMKLGFRKRTVYGGPYRAKPEAMFGVKMAREISAPYAVSIPTEDFNVPDQQELIAGIRKTLKALASNTPVYVGCMGGIGRTGLFLAALAKLSGEADPVGYVREHFNPHAVETKQQREYIRDLDVSVLRADLQLAALKATLMFWR